MKKTYDVDIFGGRGLRAMRHGIFEEHHTLSHGSVPFNSEEYTIVETPACFLRVKKVDLDTEAMIKFISRYFAVRRVNPNPRYNNSVQWSTKRGQWVNGEHFSTQDEARAFVIERNALLIPFAGSPYLAYEVDEYEH